MSLSEWIELITLIEFDVGLVSTDQSQDTEGIEDFYKILKITLKFSARSTLVPFSTNPVAYTTYTNL